MAGPQAPSSQHHPPGTHPHCTSPQCSEPPDRSELDVACQDSATPPPGNTATATAITSSSSASCIPVSDTEGYSDGASYERGQSSAVNPLLPDPKRGGGAALRRCSAAQQSAAAAPPLPGGASAGDASDSYSDSALPAPPGTHDTLSDSGGSDILIVPMRRSVGAQHHHHHSKEGVSPTPASRLALLRRMSKKRQGGTQPGASPAAVPADQPSPQKPPQPQHDPMDEHASVSERFFSEAEVEALAAQRATAGGPLYDPASPIYGDYGIYANCRQVEDASYPGYRFTGLVHKTSGLPHGYGEKAYANRSVLSCAHWVNGAPHGEGVLTAHRSGDAYRGRWSSGIREGPGFLYRRNGAVVYEVYRAGRRVLRQRVVPPDPSLPDTPEASPVLCAEEPAGGGAQDVPDRPALQRPARKRIRRKQPAAARGGAGVEAGGGVCGGVAAAAPAAASASPPEAPVPAPAVPAHPPPKDEVEHDVATRTTVRRRQRKPKPAKRRLTQTEEKVLEAGFDVTPASLAAVGKHRQRVVDASHRTARTVAGRRKDDVVAAPRNRPAPGGRLAARSKSQANLKPDYYSMDISDTESESAPADVSPLRRVGTFPPSLVQGTLSDHEEGEMTVAGLLGLAS